MTKKTATNISGVPGEAKTSPMTISLDQDIYNRLKEYYEKDRADAYCCLIGVITAFASYQGVTDYTQPTHEYRLKRIREALYAFELIIQERNPNMNSTFINHLKAEGVEFK